MAEKGVGGGFCYQEGPHSPAWFHAYKIRNMYIINQYNIKVKNSISQF